MMKTSDGLIYLKIPSNKFFLGLVRKVITELAERMDYSQEDIAKIELAVDEACTNVIQYAYTSEEKISFKGGKDEAIEIRVNINPKRIIINISDKGKEFDFGSYKLPDITAHFKEMQIHGLGLYIIKNFMDEVSYERSPDGVNTLKLVKYIKK
ncbi:MAG: ATP-binding protein [Candidatus Aureabacteria bacterium]|nr:ATP-binding protein [Candidatus Auribacterota bacterium]